MRGCAADPSATRLVNKTGSHQTLVPAQLTKPRVRKRPDQGLTHRPVTGGSGALHPEREGKSSSGTGGAPQHTMQDLLPPAGHQQGLQGHLVSLYADLDGSLQPFHFLLLCKATLVLFQPGDAFLIHALQRTNHSSACELTSCAHWN